MQFVCNGGKIKAHKFILAMCHDPLFVQLLHDHKQDSITTILIPGVNFEVVYEALKDLYLNCDAKTLLELLTKTLKSIYLYQRPETKSKRGRKRKHVTDETPDAPNNYFKLKSARILLDKLDPLIVDKFLDQEKKTIIPPETLLKPSNKNAAEIVPDDDVKNDNTTFDNIFSRKYVRFDGFNI